MLLSFTACPSFALPAPSMQVARNWTLFFFIWSRSAAMSPGVKPKLRLVSSNASFSPAFGPPICSTEAVQPLAQSCDCAAVYVRTPMLVKPFCLARKDDHAFGQSKQRFEPFSPNKFEPWLHSGLMFQPKVGTLLSMRYFAPENVIVDTGSTAN